MSTRWFYIPNIKALGLVVSDKKIFSCFPSLNLWKTCDPWGGTIFGPRGIIWTNLVDVHYAMLHTKYQGSRPCGFRQEDFSCFSSISLCKHVTPGVGQIWPLGQHLNKLGRDLLGDAAYQISRPYAVWFQTGWFFHVFPILVYVKHVIPRAGPVLALGT